MRKIAVLLAALLMLSFIGAAQPVEQNNSSASPGLTPASFFYPAEVLVEKLEVKLAGAIGGSDLKSKALANNAEERLAEADKLLEMNRSEEATEAIQKYSNSMNQSKELAARGQDKELQEKLENISSKNTEKLKEVQKKVPSQAKEAIEKAINRSQKPKVPGKPENKPGKSGKPETGKDVPGKKNLENTTSLPESSDRNFSVSSNKSSNGSDEVDNTVREFDGENILPDEEGSAESSGKDKITENKNIEGLR